MAFCVTVDKALEHMRNTHQAGFRLSVFTIAGVHSVRGLLRSSSPLPRRSKCKSHRTTRRSVFLRSGTTIVGQSVSSKDDCLPPLGFERQVCSSSGQCARVTSLTDTRQIVETWRVECIVSRSTGLPGRECRMNSPRESRLLRFPWAINNRKLTLALVQKAVRSRVKPL
jgi:hypothetical protein